MRLDNAGTPVAPVVSVLSVLQWMALTSTPDFKPTAVMFAPHQYGSVILSDIGVILWLSGILGWAYYKGFAEVFRLYLVPYLWYVLPGSHRIYFHILHCRVNHWLVLITFLQHTDPSLPHYRAPEFTFPRGALSTLDRTLLGDLGAVMGWIGGHATHGISETHVVHHVSSKIPHYNAYVQSLCTSIKDLFVII